MDDISVTNSWTTCPGTILSSNIKTFKVEQTRHELVIWAPPRLGSCLTYLKASNHIFLPYDLSMWLWLDKSKLGQLLMCTHLDTLRGNICCILNCNDDFDHATAFFLLSFWCDHFFKKFLFSHIFSILRKSPSNWLTKSDFAALVPLSQFTTKTSVLNRCGYGNVFRFKSLARWWIHTLTAGKILVGLSTETKCSFYLRLSELSLYQIWVSNYLWQVPQ